MGGPIIPLTGTNKKFLFPAKVIDNNDPLMLNRVRVTYVTPVDDINNTSMLNAVPNIIDGKKTKTEDNTDLLPEFKWSKDDPFCFLPLLPIFLKVTPKVDEYVNVLWPNPEFKFSEQFYVQGILSSALTMYKDDYAASRMFATKDRIIGPPLLKNAKDYKYFDDNTKGVFPEPDDVALMGRGTCDIIVKDKHVLLRAGKSTNIPDNSSKKIFVKQTRSFVQLSDFDTEITDLGTKNTNTLNLNVSYVKNLIEWHIINPENNASPEPIFSLNIYLYRLPEKSGYTTETLKINSPVDNADKSLVSYMNFNSITAGDVIQYINTFIRQVNDGEINIPAYPNTNPPNPITKINNQFPIVFRPSEKTYSWIKDNVSTGATEYKNISNIAEFVKFKKEGDKGFGLIFFKNTTGKQYFFRSVKMKEYEYTSNPVTYNILGADKLLILSHKTRVPSKGKIVLENSTVGGINQDYIIKNVTPNTDPMVRGDELFKFLNLVVRFLVAHVHPFPGLPPVPVSTDGVQSSQILTELLNASDTILNQEIRIN